MALELLTWAFPIVWYSIKEQGFKSQPLDYKHRIFYNLTYWPTFWPDMTHFKNFSKVYKISSRQKFWPSFMSIRPKIWSLKHTLVT